MVILIINFLLFFLPLVIWPFGPSQFEIPKVILAMLLVDILAVSVILIRLKKGTFSIHPVLAVFAVLIFLLTIYDIFFLRTSLTLFGNQFRGQGILLLWHLIIFSILSSSLPYKRVSFYLYALVLVVTFISSLFLGNSNVGRSIGTLGEPNALAAFIVFLWPFLFFAPIHKYRTYIQISCLILSLLIIFLSGSRSGLIAFIIQAMFYLSFKVSKNMRLSLVIGLLLIGMAYLLPMFEAVTYENRLVIWQTAFTSGLMSPVTGGGFGNTELLLRSVIEREHNSLVGYYVDSSHNIFLDWWVQGGLVGVGILAGLFIFAIKNFYIRKATFELMLFLGLLTVFSLNPVSVVSLIHLWWLIGQSFRKA